VIVVEENKRREREQEKGGRGLIHLPFTQDAFDINLSVVGIVWFEEVNFL
jgi:hypothetical protein